MTIAALLTEYLRQADGVRVDSASGYEKALTGAFTGGRDRPLVIEARISTSQYEAQF